MGSGSWAMDIHESGVVSGIGISPVARHVCCATLVYFHSATAENIAKGLRSGYNICWWQVAYHIDLQLNEEWWMFLPPGARLTSRI